MFEHRGRGHCNNPIFFFFVWILVLSNPDQFFFFTASLLLFYIDLLPIQRIAEGAERRSDEGPGFLFFPSKSIYTHMVCPATSVTFMYRRYSTMPSLLKITPAFQLPSSSICGVKRNVDGWYRPFYNSFVRVSSSSATNILFFAPFFTPQETINYP